MDLLSRLHLLLPPTNKSKELPATAGDSAYSGIEPLEQLLEWNNSIETHFPVVSPTCPIVDHALTLKDQLPSLSKHVLRTMVQVLSQLESSGLNDLLVRAIDNGAEPPSTESIEAALFYWKEKKQKDDTADSNGEHNLILRTAQNWLRYYIQAILAHAPSLVNNDPVIVSWSRPPQLLELYVVIMEYRQGRHSTSTKYASQILFFATFPHPLPYYKSYLVETHQLCPRLLALLVQNYNNNVSVWLSLVRNIHNALAGYHCKAAVEAASMVLPQSSIAPSWLVVPTGDGDDVRVVTYATVLRDLALYTLGMDETEQKNDTKEKKLRTELVVEILRCCYVLKIPDIHSDNQWRKLIDLLWQQENNDIRITTASILTDVPSSFCEHVPPQTLLHILQESAAHQASQNIVDDRSAAAITPLLVLLHKYCAQHASYCINVRQHLFPNTLSPSPTRARNSSPLDTPPGTLRYSIVKLLTSPQGHVKRLIGELLWTVCDEDMNEFIRRVGMGNALPLLSLKGLVTLPSSVQQHS